VPETSRIKTALRMGGVATIKTLTGFDFSFQPSLDRERIFAERLGEAVAGRSARRTSRLEAIIRHLGLALGDRSDCWRGG